MILSAAWVAGYAFYFYVILSPSLAPVSPGQKIVYAWHPLSIALHAGFGSIALLFGVIQWLRIFRERFPRTNIFLRNAYYGSVIVSSLSGFYVASYASGWLGNKLWFFLLDIVWLYSIIETIIADKNNDMPRFRMWIVRNYALTFAAVTLRLWLPILWAFYSFDVKEFLTIYSVLGFLCWVPNLLWVEWYYGARHWNTTSQKNLSNEPKTTSHQ